MGASDRTVVLAGPYIAQLPGGNEFAKVPNPLLWTEQALKTIR
ncbi:MAG: hypothetical protein MOP49_904, partial [Nitrososphaera sp.]|nr:hypothetical protein [Nitrososphaera sp.]